ncbi:hypothetical protein IWW34DRAFT_758428 [Fusarium oxysporum f. sp. albedinis]|nr:hypothetical protein IWW34DRAFT_758428 [Fusarium oxysporum f. sp. albedinis]
MVFLLLARPLCFSKLTGTSLRLYYHLAEPGPEVSVHPNNLHICMAVSQYLGFTLMALGSPGERRGNWQEERLKAMKDLKTWAEDFECSSGLICTHWILLLSDVPGDVSLRYNAIPFANNDMPRMAVVKEILEFHSERRLISICRWMKSI